MVANLFKPAQLDASAYGKGIYGKVAGIYLGEKLDVELRPSLIPGFLYFLVLGIHELHVPLLAGDSGMIDIVPVIAEQEQVSYEMPLHIGLEVFHQVTLFLRERVVE